MYIVNTIVRRTAHRVGWEIGSAVGIALFLMVCGAIACAAVAWKIMVP